MARSKRPASAAQLSFAESARPVGPELLVLPDGARVEEHLLRAAERGGLALGSLVCTVAQLERWILQAARSPDVVSTRSLLDVASPAALELVYRRVAREQTPPGSPWFLVRETPGFWRALRDLAAALGRGMLPLPELATLIPQLERGAQRRLLPLWRLLDAARRELAACGLSDATTALIDALAHLRSDGDLPRQLAGLSSVRFEAVLDWPPLRQQLLFALSERLGRTRGRVSVVLPLGPQRGRSDDPLAAVLQAIEKRGAGGAEAVPELILKPLGGESPLGELSSRLFTDGEQAPIASADVALISCASPAAEAREAAQRCADLLDAGCAADSIAVAVRDLSGGSAEELGLALDRLGIAFRERRGRPALSAPPVQLALSLYQLLERDFPRDALAALLSSRQLWMRREGERARPAAIASWLRQARVRDDRPERTPERSDRPEHTAGRRDRTDAPHREPIATAAHESTGTTLQRVGIEPQLLLLAARLRAQAAEETRAGARAARERDAAEVDEVRIRVRRATAELRTLPAQATLSQHAAALLELLDRWELKSRAQRALGEPPVHDATSRGDRTDAVRPLDRAAAAAQLRDLESLAVLEAACLTLADAAREAGQAQLLFSRTSWAELLASALAEATLNPPGARGAAVQLVELRELSGRSFDHLIVSGLVEGVLPARAPIDPLLSDEERASLNRAAGRPIFRSSPGSEEALLFQVALASARSSIRLLWRRADARGREVPRSTFADEAAYALGLHPSDGPTDSSSGETLAAPSTSTPSLVAPAPARISRAPLAAIPELSACRSPDELLARASLDAIADPTFRALPSAARKPARALIAALARSPLRAELWMAARSSLAERERLGAFVGSREPGRFSGQLSGPALAAARPLFAYGKDAPLSISLLEEDARCSFKILGHRLLGIGEVPAAEADLPPRERGTLLHRCLEAFYSAERAQGRLPIREPQQEWAPRLARIAEAEMDRFTRANDAGDRGLWKLRRRELLQMLEAVVAAEAELLAMPLELEREFGGARDGSWEPLEIPSPDGSESLYARGAIDRVDQVDAQSGAPSGALMVIDYKYRRKERLRRMLRPESLFAPEFQLALYAAVLRARHPGRSVDATFLSLRDAERTQPLSAILHKAHLSLDEVLELDPVRRAALRSAEKGASAGSSEAAAPAAPANLADAVWARVSRLRLGLLPVDSIDCEHCDLKAVCRIAALPVDEEELA